MQSEPGPTTSERSSRVAVVAALLAVCFASAGSWWFASEDEAVLAASAGELDPVLPASLFPTSFADVEKAPDAAAAVAPGGGGADDEIQLCGGHWVEAGPDGKPIGKAVLAVVRAELDEVAASLVARMTASTSPRVEAAAHYYRAVSLGTGERSAEAAVHRDALVRLAQTTDDAQVYAWAYRYCTAVASESQGGCPQLSAAQWARLDPENAEPWLAVAEEARRRNDAAALDDAMFRVAAAERHDARRAVFAATLAEFAPQDERSLVGTYAAVTHAVVIDSIESPPWNDTAAYCGAEAIADPNRRETCERVATVLVDRSTTAFARTTGLGIGKRLDWSAGRLAAVAEREEAEAAATRLSGIDAEPDLTDCAPMRALIEGIRAAAEFGQIGMLRRLASSYTVAQLAAETRRQRERDARKIAAEQAASAASAAPAPGGEIVAQR